MPPTNIPNNFGIATVRLLRTGASAPDVVTFAYACTNATTADDDATELAADWIGAFTAASTLNSYTFTGVHVLRKISSLLEAGDHVQSTAGTVNAAAASPAIAVRVTKRTLHAGRKFRGRMYLPPAYVSEANVDASGIIDGATLTSVQSHCDSFLAALTSTGTEPGMFLLHGDGSTPSPVTHLQVRTSVGTQRRRQALV